MRIFKQIGMTLAIAVMTMVATWESTWVPGGVAHAGLRDKAAERGGGGAKGLKRGDSQRQKVARPSKIDRQPRAASAKKGSIKPSGKVGKARPAKPAKRPAGVSSVSQAKAKATKTGKPARKQDRTQISKQMDAKPALAHSGKGDLRGQKVSKKQIDKQRKDLQKGRKDYEKRKKDIQKDRGDTLVELQENRHEYKQERREDRMEFAENRREDRMDFREDRREDVLDHREDMLRERRRLYNDLYDHHHYWGYYDDDDDNWFWAIFGGITGFAIGTAIASEPEGSVPVTSGGATYNYYGGTFYQPAPDGNGYVTAPAPVNAQVEAPPIDCTVVFSPAPDDIGYCYFQGAFFLYDDKSENYVVTLPQTGTEVPYLPEGYETTTVNDVEYYQLGGIDYRLYMEGDKETFVVAEIK